MQKTISVTEVFKTGWANTKKHIGFLTISTFIYLVISMVLKSVSHGPGSILINLASYAISIIFAIGLVKIGLIVESGNNPKIEDFKTDFHTFLSFFWASIIVGVLSAIGFIFLIIPGIYISTRLYITMYLILDKKMPAWDAVKKSWDMTKGYSWSILVFGFFAFIIAFVSAIPFRILLIIAIPIISMSQAVMYRKISKSSVSNPVSVTPTPTVLSVVSNARIEPSPEENPETE